MDEREELRRAMEKHCIRRSDTPMRLASGGTSYYYYNGKAVSLRPRLARVIGRLMLEKVRASGAEAVGGVAVGGVPIACAVGAASVESGPELPVFYVRVTPKEHGAPDQLEASAAYGDDGELLRPGRKVALVEDVVTTGGSALKAVERLQQMGCEVVALVSLVERHEGAGSAFRERGIPFERVFYTDEAGNLYTA